MQVQATKHDKAIGANQKFLAPQQQFAISPLIT